MKAEALELKRSLKRLHDVGAVLLENGLSEDECAAIVQEVAQRRFKRVAPAIGPVRQETELLLLSGDFGGVASVAGLREEFVRAVQAQAPADLGLGEWWPNEAYVQRYEAGTLGVTPHVDSKRFVLLGAVFTLLGSSEFFVCEGRSGPVIETWTTRPGTLVLLRGPGLGGIIDGRPFHAVRGPVTGQRYSLTLRMNAETP